jgi:hypothetical protein
VSRRPRGSSVTPASALADARQIIKTFGFQVGHLKFESELLILGFIGHEEIKAVITTALDEITTGAYTPVQDPDTVPGMAFVWDSTVFCKRMYLKFKIIHLARNKKRLSMYSCHEADYQ